MVQETQFRFIALKWHGLDVRHGSLNTNIHMPSDIFKSEAAIFPNVDLKITKMSRVSAHVSPA